MAGRLSHYSALYEVQNDQGSLPLDAVQHLHHMVHGACAVQQGGDGSNTAAACALHPFPAA